MAFHLEGFDLDAFVRDTLAEDLGEGLPGGGHDVTSESVIPAEARFSGVMDSRDAIRVAGLPVAEAFFRALDPDMTIEMLVAEGDAVDPGTDLMHLSGKSLHRALAEHPRDRERQAVPRHPGRPRRCPAAGPDDGGRLGGGAGHRQRDSGATECALNAASKVPRR